MIEILSKASDQISLDDVKSLIALKVSEGEQIEFKETLPVNKKNQKNQQVDSWIAGQEDIGDYAKNSILREVVAFANAYGGTLFLGISQSDTKLSAATGISAIPKCADLAERLRLIFRNRVEPELPRLEVIAVPTESDSGIILIRTGRSSRRPHRITDLRICPIRRADRCEEMSMREIQDMTLNLSMGLERLEKKLLGRAECFKREVDYFRTSTGLLEAFGFRLTAAPVLDEVRFDTVLSHGTLSEELQKPAIKVIRRVEGDTKALIGLSCHRLSLHNWEPRLRSARAVNSRGFREETDRRAYGEVHCDGLIEMGFVSRRSIRYPDSERTSKASLYAEMLVFMFANLVAWANQIRKQAQVPMAEYAIEVEIGVFGRGVPVTLDDGDQYPSEWGNLPPGSKTFPRYAFTDAKERSRLTSLFERDFWNYVGKDFEKFQGALEIEYIHR